MNCSNCKKQISDGKKLCPNCDTAKKKRCIALIALCAAVILACSACADKNTSVPDGGTSTEPNITKTPDSVIASLDATSAPNEEPSASDGSVSTEPAAAGTPALDSATAEPEAEGTPDSAAAEVEATPKPYEELSDFERLFVDNSITYTAPDFGELESTALASKNNDLEDIDEYIELIEIAYVGDTVCELIQTIYTDTTNFSDEYSEWLDKELRAQYAEEFKDMPFVEITYRTEGVWYIVTFAIRDLDEGNNFIALGDESMLSVNDEGKEYLSLSNIEALYLGLGYFQK